MLCMYEYYKYVINYEKHFLLILVQRMGSSQLLGGLKILLANFRVGSSSLLLVKPRNIGWARAHSAHPITTSVFWVNECQ